MKRFLQNIVCPLVALLTLSACETDVEFSGEQMESLPVLNTVITAGNPVNVYYTRSVFILDDRTTTYITDGNVELYINDTFVERLSLCQCELLPGEYAYFYGSTVAPREGDKVMVRARCGEFAEWVSGTVTIPNAPAVGDVVLNYSGETEWDVTGKGYITLSDPAEENNYYWMCGMSYYDTNPEHESNYISYDFFTYTDVAFSGGASTDVLGEILGDSDSYIIFDDSLLNGKSNYHLNVEWSLPEMWADEYAYLEVYCQQIDENLYKYYRSIELSDSASLFGEPVQVHSNVEGGLGLVGAQSSAVIYQKYYLEIAQ